MSELILHCGGNKTGSTALQQALLLGRETLADHGIAYPDMSVLFPTKPNQHWPLALGFQEHPERYYLMKAHHYSGNQINQLVENARETVLDCACNYPTTILSAEAFANLEKNEMEQLLAWLERSFSSIKVVFYARPPGIRKFYSMFQQFVKSGHAPSAPETLKHRVFNQMHQAEKIYEIFPRPLFRIFGETSLFNGDIVADFFKTSGLSEPENLWLSAARVNRSLSLWATSLIFFLNCSNLCRNNTLPGLRQEIVRLDRLTTDTVSHRTCFPESWNAQLVLFEQASWHSYLQKAGEHILAEGFKKQASALGILAGQSDFLKNNHTFTTWLSECLPDEGWLKKHLSAETLGALESTLHRMEV